MAHWSFLSRTAVVQIDGMPGLDICAACISCTRSLCTPACQSAAADLKVAQVQCAEPADKQCTAQWLPILPLTICRAVSLYFYTPISLMLTLVLIYKSRIALVIMLAYFAYIWTVGRRDVASCSYTSSWVKNWRLWGLYASYFPIRLVSLHCCLPCGGLGGSA